MKKYCHLFIMLVVLVSILPTHAQTDDPVDYIITVLQNTENYTSFEAISTTDNRGEWEVAEFSNGQAWETQIEVQSVFVRQGETVSVQHKMMLDDTLKDFFGNTVADYTAQAEIRSIGGEHFVNAAYTETATDMDALPDGWIAYDESSPALYPGLNGVLAQGVDDPTSFLHMIFQLEAPVTREALEPFLVDTRSQPAVLADGTPVEQFTLLMNKDAALALRIFFNPDDPALMRLFELASDTPLTLTLYVDETGNLRQLDYTFSLTMTDADISQAIGAPAGTTIDVHSDIRYSVVLSNINTPLDPPTAPAIADTSDLPAFAAQPIPENLRWWNDRVFYEVFVRSFYDSNGDGIGDLQGVIQKLDYLSELGVTGLWLMPIAQSPSYHGYDVVDYYTIEQDYGTNADFLQLMEEAHAREMVVIVDLVMNHTSSEHEWFTASAGGNPDYREFYIWQDAPGDYASPWGSNVWHERNGDFYYGLFWEGMPDLNYANPAVTAEMQAVIAFWLQDMGVDGFRLDAIRHLIEDGAIQENTPATLAWLEDFHAYVESLNPDALTVGEIWDDTAEVVPYVGNRVDIAFEFDFAEAILKSLNFGLNTPLINAQNTLLGSYPAGQYATFITNHDQNRIMSQLGGDEGKARVAATLLLTSAGVPFLYYGEEIGMVGEKPDERIRTPMQWDDTRIYGGFSTDAPWQPFQTGYRTNNVESQDANPDSLLNHYRALIDVRNTHPALREGALQLVETGHQGVYALLRYTADETLLVVVNLTDEPISDYALTLDDSMSATPELLFGTGDLAAWEAEYRPVDKLAPYASLIIRLK